MYILQFDYGNGKKDEYQYELIEDALFHFSLFQRAGGWRNGSDMDEFLSNKKSSCSCILINNDVKCCGESHFGGIRRGLCNGKTF